MKIDLYTKGVLTVIAVCLVILTLQNMHLIPEAYAAPASTLVGNEIRPNIDGSINVRIIEMKPEIRLSTPFDGLPIQIKDINTHDELKVKLTNSYIYTKPY